MARLPASTRKVEVVRFGIPALILIPLFALVLQTYLPLYLSFVPILDLPLLVVIYFALSRRNPMFSIASGSLIGLAQDSLTHGPIGLFGTVKTVIGYAASSAVVRLDTENPGVRLLTICVFYYVHFILLYVLGFVLLQQPLDLDWRDRIIAALVNALVGVVLFELLDRFRKPA